MTRVAGIDIGVPPAVAIPVLICAIALVSILVGRGMARLTSRWFKASPDPAQRDAPSTPRLAFPVAAAFIFSGLLLVGPEFPLLGSPGKWLRNSTTVLLVLTCAVAISRLAVAGVAEYAASHPTLAPASAVARVAVRITVAALAILMGLQALGVPVTPLLTTLGIGSLAVALALQDTLTNFFAGLYLLADRPIRPGDYIKLSENSSAEGYVDGIGWRSSRLRTANGNTVIVPNQKLSQTILTNFHLPQPDMTVTVSVTVPYDADPTAVEGQLSDELSQIIAALPQLFVSLAPFPLVRLVDLADSGMVFSCIVRVASFEAQGPATHEIRKRVVSRLARAGIRPPCGAYLPGRVPRDDRRV
jgi:small-conductance mechanosensitive channel